MVQTAMLSRSAPEAQDVPSAAIQGFVDAAERDIQYLHSFMLLRRGQVISEGWWEPYGPRYPHMLFSLSKSFTSTAIGLLVAEKKLSIDAPILSLFPGEAPMEPSANLRAMQVRHLLTMATGHDVDATGAVFGHSGPDWVRAFLAQPVVHEPGTHFVYNTAATYVLSAIIQRITGVRLLEYLRPRLFEPLGIADPTWETSPQGVDLGGTGLSVTTADIARFGQLYLQRGMWQGQRLISEDWVAAATAFQVPNGPSANPDWQQGYGYQFWRCRHGAYRGDGAFGQYCVVMPEQEAVLAITSGVPNMQRVLDLVWEHLLPAMGSGSLRDDPAAHEALIGRLGHLYLQPPTGESSAAVADRISGKTFTVRENEDRVEAIRFEFREDGATLTIRNDQGEQRIPCGFQDWKRGTAALERAARRRGAPGAAAWQVAAAGAWTDAQTYVVQLWWYETPFGRTLTCRFAGDRLTVEQQANVGFGPTERPRLEGQY